MAMILSGSNVSSRKGTDTSSNKQRDREEDRDDRARPRELERMRQPRSGKGPTRLPTQYLSGHRHRGGPTSACMRTTTQSTDFEGVSRTQELDRRHRGPRLFGFA